jgi:hypothetical protein
MGNLTLQIEFLMGSSMIPAEDGIYHSAFYRLNIGAQRQWWIDTAEATI